jgi:hypothetical protein
MASSDVEVKMNAESVFRALSTVLRELVEGAADDGGWVLNQRDPGLLRSLQKLTAAAASAPAPTGSSIAAHTDHLRYGLELLNRWSAGEENPFADADYSVSWQRTGVSEQEWAQLLDRLGHEARKWMGALEVPRELKDVELNGGVASVAHLAYHLGAIRQIDAQARGPREEERGI